MIDIDGNVKVDDDWWWLMIDIDGNVKVDDVWWCLMIDIDGNVKVDWWLMMIDDWYWWKC